MNVEDVSDECSITSTKGEGFASDFSDNELRNGSNKKKHKVSIKQLKLFCRLIILKIIVLKVTNQDLTKRPSTPMDIRQDQQNQQPTGPQTHVRNRQMSHNEKSIKFQHIGEQQVSYRFNEWEPFGKQQQNEQSKQIQQSNERQKSPLKSKHSARESSPRQSSGRGQITSASINQDRMQNDGSLDLMVSGQKFGRKDTSPTNTPREVAPLRPPTRRLQPIDRNPDALASENETAMSPKQTKNSAEIQRVKSKKLVFIF